MLEENEPLEDTLLQAEKDGMAPEQKLGLIDFWRDDAMNSASSDFQDDYKKHQEFAAFVDDEVIKAKEPIVSSVTEKLIRDSFENDIPKMNRFITELNEHGDELLKYSPEFTPVARDVLEKVKGANIPFKGGQFNGGLTDEKGNEMANYSISYNQDGTPTYANVLFNQQTSIGYDEAEGMEKAHVMLGITPKGSEISGGDVIRFPKQFNGVEYLKDQLRNKIATEQKQLTGFVGEENEPYLAAAEDRIAGYEQEIAAIDAASPALKKKMAQEGANAYIDGVIRSKVLTDDPKYAELGQGAVEGMLSSAQKFGRDAYASSVQAIHGIHGYLRDAFSPTRDERVDNSDLDVKIKDIQAAKEIIGKSPEFSRSAINDKTLANTLSKVSGAVTQGVAVAAQMRLLGAVGGNAEFFMQAHGGTLGELTAKADQLRKQGDNASADYIEKEKYGVAVRAAAISVGIEQFGQGHNPFRPMTTGSIIGEGIKDAAGEGGEEIFEGIAQAYNKRFSGVSTDEEFVADIESLPEAGLLGTIGSAAPIGARAAITGTLRSILKNKAFTNSTPTSGAPTPAVPTVPPVTDPNAPPIPPLAREDEAQAFKAAADKRKSDNVEASKTVTRTLEGQPGDHGPRKVDRKTENYLGFIAAQAENDIRELGGTEAVGLVISHNPQDIEVDADAAIFQVYSGEEKPKSSEVELADAITLKTLLEDEEYVNASPEERNKILKSLAFETNPTFRTVKNNTVSVADLGGRTHLVSDSQLLKLLENGLDPEAHFFYRHSDAAPNDVSSLVNAQIPDSRWLASGVGAGVRKTGAGVQIQSKGNEQVLLASTGMGIPTSTIGGKLVAAQEPLANLDDELSDPEITAETKTANVDQLRDDVDTGETVSKPVTGRFLTAEGKVKLVENLNKKYGKNNWLLKLDGGTQRQAMVRSWDANDMTFGGTSIVREIPVMEDMFYVAQERVKQKKQYRVSVRAGADGTLQMIPFGIVEHLPLNQTEANKGDEGRLAMARVPKVVVSKPLREKMKKLVEDLNNTGFNERADTHYGLDVIEDEKGNLRIMEANPVDDVGEAGTPMMFGSTMGGLISMAKGNFSPEAAATYAAYLKVQASEAMAAKNIELADQLNQRSSQLLKKASTGAAITKEDIPEAKKLYDEGVFFSKSNNRSSLRAAETVTIQSLGLRRSDKATEQDQSVADILRKIADTTFPIKGWHKKLAAAYLAHASANDNKGLTDKVVIGARQTGVGGRYEEGSRTVFISENSITSLLHELSHALSMQFIPSELDIYKTEFKTGADYLKALESALKNKKYSPKLKNVIRDYIAAVKGLGLENSIFGTEKLHTGLEFGRSVSQQFYGLTSLSEFAAEALVEVNFANMLANIKSETSRFYMRRLLNSFMEWVKSVLLGPGSSAKNLFDRTYNDIMMLITSNDTARNSWESDSNRKYNANTKSIFSVTENPYEMGGIAKFELTDPVTGKKEVLAPPVQQVHIKIEGKPGYNFMNSTISVPVGSTHEQILAAIDKHIDNAYRKGGDSRYSPERLQAGGGFVFGLPEVTKTRNGWAMGGKQLQGSEGTVPESGFKSMSGLRDVEINLYKYLVPDAFTGGNVNVPMLQEGLKKADNSIRVDVYGQRDASNRPEDVTQDSLDELRHTWFDNLNTNAQNAARAYAYEYDPEEENADTMSWRNQFLEDIDLPPGQERRRHIDTLEQYARLTYAVRNTPSGPVHPDQGPTATQTYHEVSPFSTRQYPVIRIDVSLSDKTEPPELKRGYVNPDPLWKQDDMHENLPNTLGWAMAQVVPHPTDKGEEVLFIGELQSRWAQKRRKQLENQFELYDFRKVEGGYAAFYKGTQQQIYNAKPTIEEAIKDAKLQDENIVKAPKHPLLEVHESLVLKKVIEEAQKRGIKYIAVSDAETAMMTEGHDAFQGVQILPNGTIRQNKAKVGDFGFDIGEGSSKITYSVTEGPDRPFTRKMAERIYKSHKSKDKKKGPLRLLTEEDLQPSQSKGMRVAYDISLPSITKKITGDKGSVTDFGPHKNQREKTFSRLVEGENVTTIFESDGGSPIFKTPEGKPKTQATALVFNVTAANKGKLASLSYYSPERLSAGSGFIFGLPQVEQTKNGKWTMGGKQLEGSQGLIREPGLKSMSGLRDVEIELYKFLVPEAFTEGVVNIPVLVEGLKKAENTVRVDVYGQEKDRKTSPEEVKFNDLIHTMENAGIKFRGMNFAGEASVMNEPWLPSFSIDVGQGITLDEERFFLQDDGKLVSKGYKPFKGKLTEQQQELFKKFPELHNKYSDVINNIETEYKATSAYITVSPFNVDKYPVTRIDVSLPSLPDEYYEGEFRIHEQPKNTLGWAMVQVVPHPVTQEPVMFVAELQSRWAQERRKLMEVYKAIQVIQTSAGGWQLQQSFNGKLSYLDYDTKQGAENAAEKARQNFQSSLNSVPPHPLLEIHQSIVLKAVIAEAEKQGISKIAVSDAETAMMTERQDAQDGDTYYIANLNGRTIRHRQGSSQTEEFLMPELVDKVIKRKGRGKLTLNGIVSVAAGRSRGVVNVQAMETVGITGRVVADSADFWDTTPEELKELGVIFTLEKEDLAGKEPKQAKGMRVAYDTTLPSIMKRLTGQNGNFESFGQHKNILVAEQTTKGIETGDVGSPVFRTKEGKRKNQVTALTYDITNHNKGKVSSLSYYSPSRDEEDNIINLSGKPIDKRFLTPQQLDEAVGLDLEIKSGLKVPSTIVESKATKLKQAEEDAKFQSLKASFPDAFNKSTNPNWNGYTTYQAAEFELIDWLVDNPAEIKDGNINSPPKDQTSKNRQTLSQRFTKVLTKLKKNLDAGNMTGYNNLTDSTKDIVNKVLKTITEDQDPEALTNRQLNAYLIALNQFIDSKGSVIRGFAKIASQIYENEEGDVLQDEKDRLTLQGIENPWGDEIDDWRRKVVPFSKTGTSIADFWTEMLAIFNRPSTRKIFTDLFTPFKKGIHEFKSFYSELRKQYDADIDAEESTTRLEDNRIGIAAVVTQYNTDEDALPQLESIINQVDESIRRKSRFGINNPFGSLHTFRRDAPIERAAFDALIGPIRGLINARAISAADIIDFIESRLSEKELKLLRIARRPGSQYYTRLDAMNQLARGLPLQNWANYAKRVQYSLNNEMLANVWGEKSMVTPDSILQPREGLGDDAVFMFNWRQNLDWQLEETAYELHTGVERIQLLTFIKSDRFKKLMDGDDTKLGRSKRILSQIGGVHSNLKNREIRFGQIAGSILSVGQFMNAKKLISLKAFANQMIPSIVTTVMHPKLSGAIAWEMLSNPTARANAKRFLDDINPDLANRLKKWDYMVDSIKSKERIKKSGMAGMNAMQELMESMMVTGSRSAHVAKKLANSPFGLNLGITITNGYSEVTSAKHVFFTLYIDKLIKSGQVSSAEDFFSRAYPVQDDRLLTEAEAEFDSYVLTPIQPEFRSEFAQRNSVGKIVANVLFFGLARTAMQQSVKSVTALRDLFYALNEYNATGSQDSLDFVYDANKQVMKQFLSISVYYGIAKLYAMGIQSLFSAASYATAAAMAGSDEDKDKWMRHLRIQDRINKEMQANFTNGNMGSDFWYFAVPMPGLFQANPTRNLISSFIEYMQMEKKEDEDRTAEIQQHAEQIENLNRVLKAMERSGVGTETEYQRTIEALEIQEYAKKLQETYKDRQDHWFADAIERSGKNQLIDSPTKMAGQTEDYAPDWLRDAFYSPSEKDKRSRKLLDQARTNQGMWALSSFFSVDTPSQSAARKVTKEFADDTIRKEDAKEKEIQGHLKTYGIPDSRK